MRDFTDTAPSTLAIADTAASFSTTAPSDRLSATYVNRLHFLWRDFFRNSSSWIDVRSTKTDPRSPDFRHKVTDDQLFVFHWLNPWWVQEELQRRGLRPANKSRNAKYGNVSAEPGIFATIEESQQLNYQVKGKIACYQTSQSWTLQSNDRTALEVEHVLELSENSAYCTYFKSNTEDVQARIGLVASIKACADQGDLLKGIWIHTQIARQGLFETNLVIGGALINMYAKCGELVKAQEVFDALPARNVVSWNTLISGYAQNQHGDKALECFKCMQKEGIFPDGVTVVCILNACGSVGDSDKGQELHAFIIKEGLLDINLVVGNALIDMYACCNLLAKAQAVFFDLPVRNSVSWTTLITGYVQHSYGEEALLSFESMKTEGFSLSMATSLTILKACGIEGALNKGREIHSFLVKEGLPGHNMMVGTALIDMYAKCGALAESQKLFLDLPMPDIVAWGALLDGFSQHGDGEEAIQCYKEMLKGGCSPDGAAFICILQASGSIGATQMGQKIHADIAVEGWFDQDPAVTNSLIDMYAKFGMVAEAQDVFDELDVHPVVTWNALMAGYAQLGGDVVVLRLFNKMVAQGGKPDTVTFLIVLIACSHRGLLPTGQDQYKSMIVNFGLFPSSEHLTCLVDLFGRAGHVETALGMINEMPVHADSSTLLAVLGACKRLGNKQLGAWALQHSSYVVKTISGAYLCAGDIYAVFGNNEGIEENWPLQW